jgi:DNA-binding CsgD family transcriptional regulator
MADGVARARVCYQRRAWKDACAGFLAALDELGADDLERLAVSAYLVGRNDESDEAWGRAHRRHLDQGDVEDAVRCAFWLGFRLVNASRQHEANAWIARIERLSAAAPDDSVARGRLAYLTGLRAAFEGDFTVAAADLEASAAIATDRGDDELAALARLALGRVRIFLGDITAGVRLLDDAMLDVGSEPISPIAVGDSYCTAIDACHDLYDVQRGQAWTEELARWCDDQPDLVPFTGVCQVHRAEFLQLKGAWVEAMAQAGLAQARLAQPFRQLAYGAARYQQGELHRLLGEFDQAEACYREASQAGRDPQPGLALLRLRQGRRDDAAQAIDRAVSEAGDPLSRSPLLAAYVEIMIGADRVDDASAAAAELTELAATLGSPLLDAVARRATGSVRLAEDDARGALADLRRASDGFRELDAPYDVARTALLIGTARAALGDEEGAALEFEAARATYLRLGARPDLSRVPGQAAAGLTAREVQVLRLVAEGATNRSIGTTLGLSERTVDRHVSNIFAKLGVSSRVAATALAHRSQLI